MLCPYCGHLKDKVTDSRSSTNGDVIRRRRHCLGCGRRFTTYERIADIPNMVIKNDQRREQFDRAKVLRGILRACEKRPVSMVQIQTIVNRAEALATGSPDRRCSSRSIGELVMQDLRDLDKVAYVRFASVYRDFQTADEFIREIEGLRSGPLVPPLSKKQSD